MDALRIRRGLAIAGVSVGLLGLGACGGDDDSDEVAVGDCIDAGSQVVECDSSEAEKKITSDQSAPDAIACVVIGDKPEVEVEVSGGTYCAEDL